MTHYARIETGFDNAASDIAAQVAQLVAVLSLVEQMAGKPLSPPIDASAMAAAVERSSSVTKRHFHRLADETAAIASTAAAALIERDQNPAAAALLADSLRASMGRLSAAVSD